MNLWQESIQNWLVDTGRTFTIASGESVKILELRLEDDHQVLDAWASHFRNQYCLDEEIDYLRDGPGLSRADYLRQIKFPTPVKGWGPSIRAGDFAEILMADYLAFVLKYWVPRTRYSDKTVRDESTKGSDTIGFRLIKVGLESPDDELIVVEAKAKLSGDKHAPKLQEAVSDSAKDYLRLAESLNAMKQQLLRTAGRSQADRIARFQNPDDRPYTARYGAVAVLASSVYDVEKLMETTSEGHNSSGYLSLWVIYGSDLMTFVHDLYDRACDGA